MFAWLVLVACADPPPPPRTGDDPAIEAPPLPAYRPEAWRLVGRARPGRVDVPPLEGGAALLGGGCSVVAARVRGDGPPCLAEAWEGPTGTRLLLVSGGRAAWADPGGDRPAQARWATLGDALTACLGDPFAVPPAGDPGGARGYDGRDWVIALTGENRCGLAGSLHLAADADRVDLDHLTVDGLRWHRGGRARAATGVRTK